MPESTRITIGDVTLTRVLYTDALVDPAATGLTLDEMASVVWNDDRWSSDGEIRVGAAAWVASHGDDHLVIDPFGNADDIFHDPRFTNDHQRAMADAFESAGVPIDAVTGVVLSHIEGLGMSAARQPHGESAGRWAPFFPNATIRVSDTSRTDFVETPADHWTLEVWRELFDSGLIDTYVDEEHLLPGMSTEWTGAHNPGHHVFHFGVAPTPDATYVGHLAVSPLHLSTGICMPQHGDAVGAWNRLQTYAQDGRILLGPLWPSPGAGRMLDGVFEPLPVPAGG